MVNSSSRLNGLARKPSASISAARFSASLAAVRLARQQGWRREKLAELVAHFRGMALRHGLELLPSDTPIQPLLCGVVRQAHHERDDNSARATDMAAALETLGYWVSAIRPPTVPDGQARLRITLSAILEEAYAGADRNVQAFHAAQHGDGNKAITGLAGQPTHTFPFRAKNPGNGPLQLHRVEIDVRIGRCSDYRYTALFQLPQRTSQISHGNIRHGIGCTTCYFVHRGGEPDGTVFRRDHGMNAKGIRHPQAGAQIVRVLYAVQHQKQRRFSQRIQHIVYIHITARGVYIRRHALMARTTGHRRKPGVIA